MPSIVWVAIGVVVILVVIAAVIAGSRRRSSRLHSTFGPEYDRTLQATGDRRATERELADRVDRRSQLEIVPLPEDVRQRYRGEWQQLQAGFVDAPVQSVQQADALVGRVMSDRGYPVAEFEQRAADISVDHPDVVENYRGAHAVSLKSADDSATTEDLRRAMTQHRALFQQLLEGTDGDSAAQGSQWQPEVVRRDAAAPTAPGQAPPPAPPQSAETDAGTTGWNR